MKKQQPDRPEQKAKKDREEIIRENTLTYDREGGLTLIN